MLIRWGRSTPLIRSLTFNDYEFAYILQSKQRFPISIWWLERFSQFITGAECRIFLQFAANYTLHIFYPGINEN